MISFQRKISQPRPHCVTHQRVDIFPILHHPARIAPRRAALHKALLSRLGDTVAVSAPLALLLPLLPNLDPTGFGGSRRNNIVPGASLRHGQRLFGVDFFVFLAPLCLGQACKVAKILGLRLGVCRNLVQRLCDLFLGRVCLDLGLGIFDLGG